MSSAPFETAMLKESLERYGKNHSPSDTNYMTEQLPPKHRLRTEMADFLDSTHPLKDEIAVLWERFLRLVDQDDDEAEDVADEMWTIIDEAE